jgi:hypothetical protein
MFIWTFMRDGPFVLGGSPKWRPTKTQVTTYAGPYDLGKGFRGFVVPFPDGHGAVVVTEGGSIVGSTLEQVRADIAACEDVAMMRQQVAEGEKQAAEAVEIPAAKFWEKYLGKRLRSKEAVHGRA